MGPSVISPVYRMTLANPAISVYPNYAPVTGTTATFGAGCCTPGKYTAELTASSASVISGAATGSTFYVFTRVRASVNVTQ
jgi:hypothetical protein